MDTMYNSTLNTGQIHAKVISSINQKECHELPSLIERCQNQEGSVKNSVQEDWSREIKSQIDSIASVNPYLSWPVVGEEVPAVSAVAWVQGARGLDTRPKLFDGVTNSWKMCDTGSMVTVVKNSPHDKVDETKILEAVNGSAIKVYGQKEIEVRLGRKSYKIDAIIADVEQDILGWDFIQKYKLNFEWNDFGDLVLRDRKANTRTTLKCVTVPLNSNRYSAVYSVKADQNFFPEVEAFEVAAMKSLTVEQPQDSEKINPKYMKLIQEFPGVTEPNFKDLSSKHGVKHKIVTSGPPCKAKVRPLMANSEKAIKGKAAWDELVRLGVVERVKSDSDTTYSSALHLVPKPDGTMRPCSDFRKLNSITVADTYPLSSLKNFNQKLHGSKVFSVIDLQAAFHNIPLDEDSVAKTTTLTPWGAFVYKRLAFGLCNAPGSFMKLLDTVLAGLDGVYAYVDDILVHAPNEEEHYKIVKEVLRRLHENGLSIKLSKCQFSKKSVEYLGYEVSAAGILPLKKKVTPIVNFPRPTTQKQLLHFLGALGYFRTSLKGIKRGGEYRNPAEILQVLFGLATTKLPTKTKLDKYWEQNPRIEQAFQDAKSMLINAVQLTHPDPNAKLILCTDASDFAIGGSLEQLGPDGAFHPLGFFSRHLGPDKHNWSTYRKELYACVQSLRHFLPEFFGRHITIYSDHLPLTKSFESNTLQTNDPVAQRQLVEIGMFTKDIQYLKGSKNFMADFLSRQTAEAKLGEAYKMEKVKMENFVKEEDIDYSNIKVAAASETIKIDTISASQIAEAQKSCPDTKCHRLGNHPTSLLFEEVDIDGFNLICEVSGSKPRPLLPLQFRQQVLDAYHLIDHPGQAETKRRCQNYYWPHMNKMISAFVKRCHPCLSTKTNKQKQPHIGDFPVPQRRFSHIQVDVCGPLPPSRGYKYLLMVVCRSTRFVDAIPMTEATTEACANALLHGWVSRHGVASCCTSDNGVEFVSSVWKKMQEKLGIKLNYTSLYSPQTNGLIERQNSTIKTSLKAALVQMGEDYKENWYDFLPWVLLMKRTSFQKELGTSPAFLAYGTNLAVPGDLLRDPGEPFTEPELEQLVKFMGKHNNKEPIPTSIKPQVEVPEPPLSVTHVYTKQHKTTGLQPSFIGPFPVVDRPSRSQVKIRVGFDVHNNPRYELRNWRDLKIAEIPEGAEEASRPKRGRPPKATSAQSKIAIPPDEPGKTTSGHNKDDGEEQNNNKSEGGKIQTTRPLRSTRNPHPVYVDSITTNLSTSATPRSWSASKEELAELNSAILSDQRKSG